MLPSRLPQLIPDSDKMYLSKPHYLAGFWDILELIGKIGQSCFMFDDWIFSMQHEHYLRLCLIIGFNTHIKLGNALDFNRSVRLDLN